MATLKTFLFVFFMLFVLFPLGIYAKRNNFKFQAQDVDAGKYLEQYGYMEYARLHLPTGTPYDQVLTVAVREFQLNFGLAQTGVVDSETKLQMSVPRCGVSDFTDGMTNAMLMQHRNRNSASKYDFFPGRPKWAAYDLNYKFLEGFPENAKSDVAAAFGEWEQVSEFVFHEVGLSEDSHIVIGFYSREHGDGLPFDGPGEVLAHAFAPPDGRLHFDADEDWSFNVKPGADVNFVDFKSVAMHEIGHILGMEHTKVAEALMAPRIRRREVKNLTQDDIDGINDLYFD